MPFELPPLPYDYDALEPTIDEQTMHIHHGKHHQAYVDNAEQGARGHGVGRPPVEDVLAEPRLAPARTSRRPVRNNAGGHANHSLFWQIMQPNGGGEPGGDLAAAIDDAFGDFDELKAEFERSGVKRFGSGWTWLVW